MKALASRDPESSFEGRSAEPDLAYRDAGLLDWAVAGATVAEVAAALRAMADEAGPDRLRHLLGAAAPAGDAGIAEAYVERRMATVRGLLALRASFSERPREDA